MRATSTSGGSEEVRAGALLPSWRLQGNCLVAMALTLFLGLFVAASADAATPERFPKETFGSAAQPAFGQPQGLAIDESDGDLLVMDQSAGTISRYKADGTPDNFSALGSNVITEANRHTMVFAGAAESQIAVDNSRTATDGNIYVTDSSGGPGAHVVDIFARSGEYLGDLTEGRGLQEGQRAPFEEACGVAVDPSGAVYVGDYNGGVDKFIPAGAAPTDAGLDTKFTPHVREVCTLAAGTMATNGALFVVKYNGTVVTKVNASTGGSIYDIPARAVTASVISASGRLLVAKSSGEVTEYDASGESKAAITGALNAGTSVEGVAGLSTEVYLAKNQTHTISVFGDFFPPPALDPAVIEPSGVTFHGLVFPEGLPISACEFDYRPASDPSFNSHVPCDPPAGSIPADSSPHQVTATVPGLPANETYQVRLTTTNADATLRSEVRTFHTAGVPRVSEVRASYASQTSAILEAEVSPSGFATSYQFVWGPTASYGHSAPMQAQLVGAGGDPVLVTADISGLAAGSTYHYRIVASSSAGTTESADQEVETVNSCGLPDLRCLELVSPRVTGPISQPGVSSNEELDYQAGTQEGSLMYSVANGLPGTSKAAEVLYQAVRGPQGWNSSQFSPAISSRNETAGPSSLTSRTDGLSGDLSCGIVVSNQLLTADPGSKPVVEAGGSNLYRRNPDGSYTAITKTPPENLGIVSGFEQGLLIYTVLGYSEDCSKVVFESFFRYPGVPTVNSSGTGLERFFYEWDEGKLRNIGIVPTETGDANVAAAVGKPRTNAVSSDGRRVFFTAARQSGPNPAEIGQFGLFVREDGSLTRDISQSSTAVPDEGAEFQYASADGSRAFFSANAGLTAVSSAEGNDLYEYNLESDKLVDLTATGEVGGAHAAGVIGASSDGSRVYFAAQGRLVTGRGATLAENEEANTYSIYSEKSGSVSYAGVFTAADLGEKNSASVSATGRYLLFQSSANVTGYSSGGVREAYLFDAESAVEPIVCVSCRQDGQPSIAPVGNYPLGNGDPQNNFHGRARLVVRHSQPLVFFTSLDDLAAGSAEQGTNLYEWAHHQIFLITAEPPGLQGPPDTNNVLQENVVFIGASAHGSDLYFNTPAALTWEDPDHRKSVYDARVDGGFTQPQTPPVPCAAVLEGACQGPSAASPPVVGNPSSSTFVGPHNVRPPCRKGLVRKKGKCVKRHPGKKMRGPRKKNGSKKHGTDGHGKENPGSPTTATRPAHVDPEVGK